MLNTNFTSNYYTQSLFTTQNPSNVNISQSFVSSSLEKLIVYALFVNFLQIKKALESVDDSKNITHSYKLAGDSIDRLKSAMVKASKAFKTISSNKYAKICYLYKQLVYYTSQNINFSEQYIRVIIE
jgi:hypothetical protein